LIKKLASEETLSESSLRKLSDLVKSQPGNTKLNRRKLIEMLSGTTLSSQHFPSQKTKGARSLRL
jgi:hypothetical protein